MDGEFALHWNKNTSFTGSDSKIKFAEIFQNTNTRNANAQPTRLGVQVGLNSANSIMKSWSCMFTDYILNKIVKCANGCRRTHYKNWNDLGRMDMLDFNSILFIVSIQKTKDKSSHWFSEDPMLENLLVKKIVSGNEFH